jgi:hypothetical protein
LTPGTVVKELVRNGNERIFITIFPLRAKPIEPDFKPEENVYQKSNLQYPLTDKKQ